MSVGTGGMDPELVVFDLAGTTIHTADLVPAALRAALAPLGIALTDAEIAALRGRSKRAAIEELTRRHVGAEAGARAAPAVQAEFQSLLKAHCRGSEIAEFPGAGEVLRWLRRRGVKVALTTGFERTLAEMLIARVGFGDLIDALVCDDDVAAGRPAPYLIFRALEQTDCRSVRRVAAVGDTQADLWAAHHAGVAWGIGVTSGAHGRRRLEACPHYRVLASVGDLPSLIAETEDAMP